MYGLPEPREQFDELQSQRYKYDPSNQLLLCNQLCTETPCTTEQQTLLNEIIEEMEQKTQRYTLFKVWVVPVNLHCARRFLRMRAPEGKFVWDVQVLA